MAAGDALHVSGGVTDARDARVAQGGLLALQGPGAMDVRTGVLFGPGSAALVTGTAATAPMTVAIAPHVAVTSRSAANGPLLGPTLDAATTVPIGAAPASGSRTDVVYVKQSDADPNVLTPDSTTAPVYGVVQGQVGGAKPPLPVGAEELATVAVSAGATATNGAGVTITNTVRQTVARGSAIPVRSQAARDLLSANGAGYLGLTVKRLDVAYAPMESYDPAADRWQRHVLDDDTGWVSVPTQPGFGNNAGGLQVRRIARRVQCRFGWTTGLALNATSTVAFVPAGFRPAGSYYGWVGTSAVASTGRVNVSELDGAVAITPGGSALSAYFRMDPCTWLVD